MPIINALDAVILCLTNKLSADEAVAAYDALIALSTYDAVDAFVANDADTACSTYDAVLA